VRRSAWLVVVAVGWLVLMPGSASAQTDGAVARLVAQQVAEEWSRAEPQLLGIEPAHSCAPRSGLMSCKIGMVTVRGSERVQATWHCTATVLVAVALNWRWAQRRGSSCGPMPAPVWPADPVAAFGVARALGVNGELACVPAGRQRQTCVAGWVTGDGRPCVGAVSVAERDGTARLLVGTPTEVMIDGGTITARALGPVRCQPTL
jgi:hypothetical protein